MIKKLTYLTSLSRETTFISARQKPSDHAEFIPSFLSRKVKNKQSLQIFRAADWAYPARSFPPVLSSVEFVISVASLEKVDNPFVKEEDEFTVKY